MSFFERKLRKIINECCLESQSDTPDFILAEYMVGCLNVFTDATNKRDEWYMVRKTEEAETEDA